MGLATIGVSQFELAYKQQYRPFGDGMWLPVDFRISIDMEAGLPGLRFPFMKRDILQRLSDYQVNPVLPDSLFVRKHFDRPETSQADSLFAHFRDAIPLSTAETEAYAGIDSSVSLLESFRPSGIFARLMPAPVAADTSTRDKGPFRLTPALRANRVDAFFLGAEATYALSSSLLAHAGGGYSAGLEPWSYGGGLASTLGTQWRATPSAEPTPAELLFRLRFNDERHRSVPKSKRFDPLDRYEEQRPNPAIERGSLRSLTLAVEHGELYPPWSLTTIRGLRAQAEYAGRSLRTLPFELLDLQPLVSKGIGVIAHGASGRTWIPADRMAALGHDPVYTEAPPAERVGLRLPPKGGRLPIGKPRWGYLLFAAYSKRRSNWRFSSSS